MCDSPVKGTEKCVCRGAALRAYNGMLKVGAAETEALDAAYRVYGFHHPEDPRDVAHLTVERWVYAERVH